MFLYLYQRYAAVSNNSSHFHRHGDYMIMDPGAIASIRPCLSLALEGLGRRTACSPYRDPTVEVKGWKLPRLRLRLNAAPPLCCLYTTNLSQRHTWTTIAETLRLQNVLKKVIRLVGMLKLAISVFPLFSFEFYSLQLLRMRCGDETADAEYTFY